jgi:general stress protein YciG
MDITEFARRGGIARAKKLSKKRRRQIASAAGKKGGRPRNIDKQSLLTHSD